MNFKEKVSIIIDLINNYTIIGFFAEHGPLHLNDDDTISMNPYAWNMNANMIYLEAPIGVGFSKVIVIVATFFVISVIRILWWHF